MRPATAGTDSQRLLVATMRRLTPPVMMMAVNHKGRVIYANTQLATLLGYKLKQLRCALCPPAAGWRLDNTAALPAPSSSGHLSRPQPLPAPTNHLAGTRTSAR
jgi:hypothetical protein